MSQQTFGQIQLPQLGTRLMWLIFGLIMIALAWEGNTGKGLAAFISPRSLKIKSNADITNIGAS